LACFQSPALKGWPKVTGTLACVMALVEATSTQVMAPGAQLKGVLMTGTVGAGGLAATSSAGAEAPGAGAAGTVVSGPDLGGGVVTGGAVGAVAMGAGAGVPATG